MTWNDPPRRLVRRRDGKILAGVCAGLADYFDVDVNLVRIVTVVLGVATGILLPAYLLAWLIVPEEGAEQSEIERLIDRSGLRRRGEPGDGQAA
ncbi:MAG: PspC domain-containing protein [Acidimicrobiales bacterium]